jgi:hypothetical protein
MKEDKQTGHNDKQFAIQNKKTGSKITQNFARFYNCHMNGINVLKKV